MPRSKTFDTDIALNAVLEAFWSRGFASTSVEDLVQTTGLGRGSLYNFYPGKGALFRAALLRYDEVWTTPQLTMLAGDEPLRARITKLLVNVIEEETATEPEHPRGCFAVNTALELASHDEEIRQMVSRIFLRVFDALCAAIGRDREERGSTSEAPVEDVALLVLNTMYGLRVLGKTMPADRLLPIVDLVLLSV